MYILLILVVIILIYICYVYFVNQTDVIAEHFSPEQVEEPFDNFFVNVYNTVFDYPYLFTYDGKLIKKYAKPEHKILDAGTGVGRHYKVLYDSGCKNIIGVDMSGKMINKAKARCNGDFQVGDLMSDDLFKSDAFDVITCLQETIYHNNNDKIDRILKNFHRWLKKDGVLIMHIFNTDQLDPAPKDYSQYYTDNHGIKHSLTYFDGFIHDAWWDDGKYYQRVILEDGHNKVSTLNLNMIGKKELVEKIQKAGFKMKEVIDYRHLNITQYEMYVFSKS